MDELGYLSLSEAGVKLLFSLFSNRHERKSTLITTNLPFEEWDTVFKDPAMTVALVDRLAHHCHLVQMNGDSYRFFAKRTGGKAKPESPGDYRKLNIPFSPNGIIRSKPGPSRNPLDLCQYKLDGSILDRPGFPLHGFLGKKGKEMDGMRVAQNLAAALAQILLAVCIQGRWPPFSCCQTPIWWACAYCWAGR